MIRMSSPIDFLNKVLSGCPLSILFLSKKLLSLSYHALKACFRPYNDFLTLSTCSGNSELTKPEGYLTSTSSLIYPFRNALLTSI